MHEYLNPIFLSRIQFAFVISFHIIFPALTIGLASWLMVLEGLWLKTKHPIYKEIYQHWLKIFSVAFGMGVVSGVVMSYQFGTNWAVFSHKAGNVIGPLLAFEVLTAFFLEASFLGIMLFGWNRVGNRLHFFATCMVAIGTLISSFWILSVNSWMQTPAGFTIDSNGIFSPANWLEIIFNPSFIPRLLHMVTAAYLCTAFLVAGVAAWYLIKKQYEQHAKVMFAMAMLIATTLPLCQLFIGHHHGANTLQYQPAKIAAMEGIWETEAGANLNLFGWPNATTETTDYALQIPKAASWILKGDTNATIRGLKSWPKQDRPPVLTVFLAFRIMVGIGMLMIITGILAVYLLFKNKLFTNSNFHKWCILIAPSGFIALLAGWITTEVGRQPYVIYGIMRTKDAISTISTTQVSISLLGFVIAYSIVFSAGIFYIFKLIKKGPLVGDWHDVYGAHELQLPITINKE